MYYIYYDIIDEFRVLVSWRPNDVLFFKKNFNVLRLDGVGGGELVSFRTKIPIHHDDTVNRYLF